MKRARGKKRGAVVVCAALAGVVRPLSSLRDPMNIFSGAFPGLASWAKFFAGLPGLVRWGHIYEGEASGARGDTAAADL